MMKITGMIALIVVGTLMGLLFIKLVPEPPFSGSHANTMSLRKIEKSHRSSPRSSLASTFTPFSLKEIADLLEAFGLEANPTLAQIQLALSLAMLTDAELDAEHLIDLIEASEQPDDFRSLVQMLFERIARNDPQTSLEMMMELKHTQLRWAALRGSITSWAKTDPEACWTFIRSQKSGFIYEKAPPIFLSVLAKSNPVEALKRARKLQGSSAINSVIATWIGSDSEAAIRYVMAQDEPQERSNLLGAAIEAFIWKEDKPTALKLALSLPNKESGDSHIRKIFSHWAVIDTEVAKIALLELPEERLNEALVQKFAASLVMSDRDEVVSFASTIPEGELREGYWEQAVIARSWKDPADAAQLTENLPEGRRRNKALRRLMSSWVEKDQVAAATWLNQLPQSSSRDAAVSEFSFGLFGLNPERAVEWASSISNKKHRERQVNKLMKKWRKADAEAAERWLENSD